MAQLLWLRNDLRLHDHEGFRRAVASGKPLAVVFVLPEHWLTQDAQGMTRLGAAKTHFLRSALIDLHRQLEDQTIDFHMLCGDPVSALSELAAQMEAHMETHGERVTILTSAAQAPEESIWLESLKRRGMTVSVYDSQTLFSTAQGERLFVKFPGSFSRFRNTVEKRKDEWQVAQHHDAAHLHLHEFPLKTHNGISWPVHEQAVQLNHAGGERAALAWLKEYLWEQHAIKHYKATRNALMGRYDSSHLSAFLAWGCLSVRYVWHEILKYEAACGASEHTYWLRFELLWREFFHWSMRYYGNEYFLPGGIQQQAASTHGARVSSELPPEQQAMRWQAWCRAETGVPMVDAGLKELSHTGHVSNRLRQNLASYFIHQLQLDWRLGARWFEMHLADYDVGSNYGNWAYIAGVGHDSKPVREFNLNRQLRQYDAEAAHIHHWLPELAEASLSDIIAHQTASATLANYPTPVVAAPDGQS